MNKKLTLLIFIIVCFLTSSAFADGSLIGVVSDSLSGFDLPGANIMLQGTVLGASTDLNGEYRISNVPAGSYKVVISYIGYQTKNVDVEIANNETKVLSVLLFPEAIEGEVIVVTAQARGQQQAINQQIASDNIANIVSEQRIQELPDFNAAAALSRLPGISTTKSSGEDNKVVIRGLSPKYNSIEIEGIKLSSTGSADMGIGAAPVYAPGVSNDRSVDLTGVSPYMIRTIAVYKSLTPDMNANSIGGTVNMELREAPSGFRYDVLWQSGYTAKSNTYGNYRGVVSASNRFFDENLGVYALANLESYDRNADNMDVDYGLAETSGGQDTTITIGHRPVQVNEVKLIRHLETRKRYGANLILDYKLPDGSVKFVNMFARLNSDYTDHKQSIDYKDNPITWQLRQGENITDQQLHSIKLDYNFGFVKAGLAASYTAANNVLDDAPILNFDQDEGVKVERRDDKVPELLPTLVSYKGDSAVVLNNGVLFSNDYKEDKYSYKADFDIPFNIGTAVSGSFKFGGQYVAQSNSTDQEAPYGEFDGDGRPTSDITAIRNALMRDVVEEFNLIYSSEGNLIGPPLKNKDNDIYDAFLDDDFGQVLYASNPDLLKKIMKYIASDPDVDATDPDISNGRSGGWYNGPYQQLTNDYEYNEDYYAAYAMSKINWMDFVIIGGVRYEKVESDYFAYNALDLKSVQEQEMYDTTSVSENDFILPMGQIKYSPFDWMDVRYAYSQTLSRPDYSSLTPKFTLTQGSGDVYAGNTHLKPAKAVNHDLNFTFHANKVGLLTIGGFYKTVEDFVFDAEYDLDAGDAGGIDTLSNYQVWRDGEPIISARLNETKVHRPINNPFNATIKGLELDLQHNFWYLPSPFNNMVFGINYARIYSKTKYPFYNKEVYYVGRDRFVRLIDSSSTGRLIDQPNHVLNSYIGYDYKGFSARVSFLFQDNSYRSNGGEYPENDTYTKEYFRIDFSARQQLPWYNSELFLDISNLNDENNRWIQDSIKGFQGIRNYGLTANLGLRIRY